MNCRRWRARLQCRQQSRLAKRRQFFEQRRVRHCHVQYATPHLTQARLPTGCFTHGCIPRIFQFLPGMYAAITPYGK